MGVVGHLADVSGLAEGGIRLLICVFLAYPQALIYRLFMYNKSQIVQYLYIALCGAFIMYFSYGMDMWHSALDVLLTYLICLFFGGTQLSVFLAYVAILGHLMAAYWFSESDQYDITWTTPQCILTLRLIGLVMDVYDGNQSQASLRKEQRETAITDTPSLLEVFAYTYNFSSLLVGPQFPLSRLRSLTTGRFHDPKTNKPRADAVRASLLRMASGVPYIVFHLIGSGYIPSTFLNTAAFYELSFVSKWVAIVLWYRIVLARYSAVWILNEASSIASGLAFNGVDADGAARWDGVRDFHITTFELRPSFSSVVSSFNFNTNQWMRKHVFLRLRFLNNKIVSHLTTLLLLALWHGYHLGYFTCFLYEFVCIVLEQRCLALVSRLPKVQALWHNRLTFVPFWLLTKTFVTMSCAYGFLSFGLIKKDRWFAVFQSIYFSGWISHLILAPLVLTLIHRVVRKGGRAKKTE